MITNVAPVHLEFFPDLEAIAEAKAEVLVALGEGGHFLYNADDPEVRRIARRCSFASTSFGLHQPADFRAAEGRFTSTAEMKFELQTPEEAFQVSVPFSGKHFLYNIAAAAAAAHVWGVSPPEIKEGLNRLRALPRRGQTITLEEITIWDESYNSNPSAMECLLDTLLQIEGYQRKILVLGDMLELGETSPRLHYQLGPSISRVNPGLLVTVGDYSRQMQLGAIESGLAEARCAHFEKAIAAARFLQDIVRAGDLVVVKGSRAIQMDQVVEVLQEVRT
jgi:UDP-N-acetylmuramoyl-tripeptide--D-alanyl-D-alanine ligase